MDWFSLIGTTLITSLLSLGANITALIQPSAAPTTTKTDTNPTQLVQLPSAAIPLPDILVKNTAYQQASLAGSQNLTATQPTNAPADALVNIYCSYRTDDMIRYTTGSGFFITPTGVILTNAHVAQFLLLETVSETGTTECIVRHGDPATPKFEADLLYISPAWIQQHAALIADAAPRGTGERDYALLYLREGVGQEPLPATVPYVAVDTALPNTQSISDVVTIGGYPTLNRNDVLREDGLPRATATTTLVDLLTFGSNYGDIYFLGGSAIGAQGISGGPVVNADGKAIGLISTRGNDTRQGAGSLNAITLSYIDRTIEEETGFPLERTVSGDIAYKSFVFRQTLVPFLAAVLEREL